jgi:ribosomal protein L32
MSLSRFLRGAEAAFRQRSFPLAFLALRLPQLALAGPVPAAATSPSVLDDLFSDPFLFAAPKRKVTRQKKRLKTTVQKRIPLRKDIVVDPRTQEVTLMHKLPFNWKDYLPKPDDKSPFGI